MHLASTYYDGIVITPDSFRLWKSSGNISDHSIDDGMCGLEITERCAANASQIIKIKNKSAVNDNNDPIDDTIFHFMNASG